MRSHFQWSGCFPWVTFRMIYPPAGFFEFFFKEGLPKRPGDRSWSFPVALEEERLKATPGDKILKAVAKKLFAESKRLSAEAVPMVVLRDGRPVQLTMPPLLEKTDGMKLMGRSVPRSVFEDWKKNTALPPPGSSPGDGAPQDPNRADRREAAIRASLP